MARYLEIGRKIAHLIRSGQLPPGTELPAIRETARAYTTTSSTVVRAYRYLAEGGVITLADRRRATVATDGKIAAARLLEADRVFRLAGSDDPALQIMIDRATPDVVPVGDSGSFHGLRALARGTADGAAIHLRHHNGIYNAPPPPPPPHPSLAARTRPARATRQPTTIAALARLRVAKREIGSGTRALLDQLLIATGIDPDDVKGPTLRSHLEIGLAVASGIADVGLGVRAAANDSNLCFIPVTWEPYDIALSADALGAARPLLTTLRDPTVQALIAKLGGYDLQPAGIVEPLSD